MFLLDTDHIVILQSQRSPECARLQLRMAQHASKLFFFSIVSFHEQLLGANAYLNRAKTDQGMFDGYRLFEQVRVAYAMAQVLPFDMQAISVFSRYAEKKNPNRNYGFANCRHRAF